jgi:hypothetical protein
MEPMPGWRERRRRVLPPAAHVVDRLPSGAITGRNAQEARSRTA